MAEGEVLERLGRLVFPREIGRSAEGRPIVARRMGNPGRPASLLVVAGVHGDEPSSVDAAADLLRWLQGPTAPAPDPFWLVPALNPDGLQRGSKNSARDVDLNRNFPARNFAVAHRPGYSSGGSPLSEPETRALAALIEAEPITRVVAIHAPLACINYDGPAEAWAKVVAAASGWPARADIGYPTPGSLGSWFGQDLGRPILTLELPPGPFAGFAAAGRAALAAAIGVVAAVALFALRIGETL